MGESKINKSKTYYMNNVGLVDLPEMISETTTKTSSMRTRILPISLVIASTIDFVFIDYLLSIILYYNNFIYEFTTKYQAL